jgi:hypothetical protein
MDGKKKKHYVRPLSSIIALEYQWEMVGDDNTGTHPSVESPENIIRNKWDDECENRQD